MSPDDHDGGQASGSPSRRRSILSRGVPRRPNPAVADRRAGGGYCYPRPQPRQEGRSPPYQACTTRWTEPIGGTPIGSSGSPARDTRLTRASAAFFPGYPMLIRATTGGPRLGEPTPLSSSPIFRSSPHSSCYSLSRLRILLGPRSTCSGSDRVLPSELLLHGALQRGSLPARVSLAFWWARSAAGGQRRCGLFAAATRSIGALLVPSLLMAAWRRGHEGRRGRLAWATTPLSHRSATRRIGGRASETHSDRFTRRRRGCERFRSFRSRSAMRCNWESPESAILAASTGPLIYSLQRSRSTNRPSLAIDLSTVPALCSDDDPGDSVVSPSGTSAAFSASVLARRLPALLGDGDRVSRPLVRGRGRDVLGGVRSPVCRFHELGVRLLGGEPSSRRRDPRFQGRERTLSRVRKDPRPAVRFARDRLRPRNRAASRR